MDKDFELTLKEQINILVSRPDYKTDVTLRRIVEILNQVKTPRELSNQKGLITHMTIDCVDNQETGNKILVFLRPY